MYDNWLANVGNELSARPLLGFALAAVEELPEPGRHPGEYSLLVSISFLLFLHIRMFVGGARPCFFSIFVRWRWDIGYYMDGDGFGCANPFSSPLSPRSLRVFPPGYLPALT